MHGPTDLGAIRQFPAPLREAVVTRLREAIISGQLEETPRFKAISTGAAHPARSQGLGALPPSCNGP